ncbi:hypothetical protein MIB92_06535 [Aestuariirhabdus sp. Z084]|uniref:hypothetical protein n=1 Tax=Aestuariirhabdus haliotis TaxID=2918751 RepID=UPI00201B4440|nr:hypothetical protein [Aestuariirhabdus haliotis]MCL6415300.1 hypothetical protein [Aestuariirhabdus haliotis]MCL6419560.1 hypothetical protein [Aestuariirhabdus haliotis]
MNQSNQNKVHGAWLIQPTSERVLLVWVSGRWNREAVKQYGQDLARLLPPRYIEQTWGAIVFANNWGMATRDSEPEIIKLRSWAIDHGQRGTVYLFDRLFPRLQIESVMSSNQAGNIPLVFKSNVDDAILWLEDKGFSVPREEVENFFAALPVDESED